MAISDQIVTINDQPVHDRQSHIEQHGMSNFRWSDGGNTLCLFKGRLQYDPNSPTFRERFISPSSREKA